MSKKRNVRLKSVAHKFWSESAQVMRAKQYPQNSTRVGWGSIKTPWRTAPWPVLSKTGGRAKGPAIVDLVRSENGDCAVQARSRRSSSSNIRPVAALLLDSFLFTILEKKKKMNTKMNKKTWKKIFYTIHISKEKQHVALSYCLEKNKIAKTEKNFSWTGKENSNENWNRTLFSYY